jgi:hypothetical protein
MMDPVGDLSTCSWRLFRMRTSFVAALVLVALASCTGAQSEEGLTPEGCIYSDRGHDQQVFLRAIRPAPNPGKSSGDVPTPGEKCRQPGNC